VLLRPGVIGGRAGEVATSRTRVLPSRGLTLLHADRHQAVAANLPSALRAPEALASTEVVEIRSDAR
jgi:hypothetical protein